jgi:phosphate starvation-inducible protein PhoH
MNKKLFLKLGLLLLSLSFVACGQKNNLSGEDNSSKASTSKSVSSTQSSGEESVKTRSPSVENAVESKKEDEDVQKNTQQDTQQEATEKEYYDLIKEAWQKQKDYIDSIDDPKVKQSVQTSQSAAIMESTGLLMEHPEDSEDIKESLKRVLNGE